MSCVFDLSCGSGYMLAVSIAAHESFEIADFDLLPPWEDRIDWLEFDEKASMYRFPNGFEFDRKDVVNHRTGRLQRGQCIEGLLLGIGFKSIPDACQRGFITAELQVGDHLGTICSYSALLMVDRTLRRRSLTSRGAGMPFSKHEITTPDTRGKQPPPWAPPGGPPAVLSSDWELAAGNRQGRPPKR